jgi:Zn-finger nucleic acid-binding protein
MPRNCPDCKIALVRKDFSGLELDACPQCAGVFFDDGELTDLRRQGSEAFGALDEEINPEQTNEVRAVAKLRLCPGCGNAMTAFRYLYSSPVILDSCDNCGGIWIDNGELKQMQEYLRHEIGRERITTQVQAASPVTSDRARIAARAMRYLALRRR